MVSTLLPVGLYDNLPPESAFEAKVVARLLKNVAAHGYEAVSPPLLEFEESLKKGMGKALSGNMFRVMDPLSHKMMGIRPDLTPQVVRIAQTRLKNLPRPLRLSYAGPVLRVEGEGLNARRQSMQAGLELIGPSTVAADVEVLRVVLSALKKAKVKGLSVDFSLPQLLPLLLGELAEDARVLKAISQKNIGTVKTVLGAKAALVDAFIKHAGLVEMVLKSCEKLDIPPAARTVLERLKALVSTLQSIAPEVSLTADLLENHGVAYHAGISFTIYSSANNGTELGRGGRYYTRTALQKKGGEGDACGCTLSVDALLTAVPRFKRRKRLLLPFGTPEATRQKWIAEKYIAVQALEALDNVKAEAKRLHCDFYLERETLQKV